MSKIPEDKRNQFKLDQTYWRSLEQLQETDEFKTFLQQEFPSQASELIDPVSRRTFLQLMAASLGFAGLQACRRPVEKILPYTKAVEGLIPGISQHYSSTFTLGRLAWGIVVESHEGRPTKIEGNPTHPDSLGAANAWMQASVLSLYDPERSQHVLHNKKQVERAQFVSFAKDHFKQYLENQGAGLAFLSEYVTSPTLLRLRNQLQSSMPQAVWTEYEPVNDDNAVAGAKLVASAAVRPVYSYDKANVIVSFGADFLGVESSSLANIRQFAQKRGEFTEKEMNRLYVAEANFTTTGASADHRLRVSNYELIALLSSLVLEVVAQKGSQGTAFSKIEKMLLKEAETAGKYADWVKALAKDLIKNSGRSIVIVGRNQDRLLHALAYVLNDFLGNHGQTIKHISELDNHQMECSEQLRVLENALQKRAIKTLVILGGNPLLTVASDRSFLKQLQDVETIIHVSDYVNETSAVSHWHLPKTHYLESWDDAVSWSGVASLVQPLVHPLFDASFQFSQLLSLVIKQEEVRPYSLVQDTWKQIWGVSDLFGNSWQKALKNGVCDGSPWLKEVALKFKTDWADTLGLVLSSRSSKKVQTSFYELSFIPSYQVYDGRFANNPWLQELPDPITKLTWDNALLVSPKTAESLLIKSEDVVEVTCGNQSIDLPVWVQPGQADRTLSIALGHGQKGLGSIASKSGMNIYPLRKEEELWSTRTNVKVVAKAGRKHSLACTQDHHSMEGRPIIREAGLEQFLDDSKFAQKMVEHPPLLSIFQEHSKNGHQWGLAVDLNKCIGCGACTIACQAENNIPVVGKEQVKKGREMHWIRIDRYFKTQQEESEHSEHDKSRSNFSELQDVEIVYQPVMCMHCENAPCEQVCPVGATVHSPEGLNDMVYNRCIGTRYCSNNCPYKVRRFNFLNWHGDQADSRDLQHNPNVSVRMRGVMEKCTYCVQRINEAKIQAKVKNNPLKDGDVVTACAQTCPAEAIVFGDISDPESRISKLKSNDRNYELLAELNVKPRTSYLAKIRHFNTELI